MHTTSTRHATLATLVGAGAGPVPRKGNRKERKKERNRNKVFGRYQFAAIAIASDTKGKHRHIIRHDNTMDMGGMNMNSPIVTDSADMTMNMDDNSTLCDGSVMGSAMLMMGFGPSWGSAASCCIFLFQNFKVNSVGTLVGTYLITIMLGLIVHLMGYFRLRVKRSEDSQSVAKRTLQSVLYLFQVAAGYLLMLVVMTYVLCPESPERLSTSDFLPPASCIRSQSQSQSN